MANSMLDVLKDTYLYRYEPTVFWIIFWTIIVSLGICIITTIFNIWVQATTKIKIEMLSEEAYEITPVDFFELRNRKIGKKRIYKEFDFSGVYILFNEDKNMYYVGQGKSVFERVNNHFTGKGNGDVYADYKYGDSFKIKMISLDNSGFTSLNELERATIKTYNAYSQGYNKTRGNR